MFRANWGYMDDQHNFQVEKSSGDEHYLRGELGSVCRVHSLVLYTCRDEF